MSVWRPITGPLPATRRVLLKWDKCNRIEDGIIYPNEDVPGAWYHVLFDGESLNDQPDCWAEIPE